MGRRDAVQTIVEIVAECRRLLPSLIVTYEPNWERRGNGTTANYEGGIVHHTASASSLTRPFPTQNILRDGRSDLPGPLCNFAGPACTPEQPRLHVMSANPANHAGASGGRSMGPLPKTSLFNPRVLGLEIDYAGTAPMLFAQLVVAKVWTKAVANVLARGNVEVVRAHMETSVTGKWDVGFANGKTYDMAGWRRDAAGITYPGPIPARPPAPLPEEDVPLTQSEVNWIADTIANRGVGATYPNGEPIHAWEAWRDAALKSVDVNALAGAIVAKLPPAATGGLSKADVEAAVRAVFSDAAS